MHPSTPAAPAVRATLERILASETFARSERARALLAHLVEEDLAGRADRLKGTSVALDVFGRGSGFDGASDAVVRVQAGRLRELLTQYYACEGSGETLRISVPRGGYAPAYDRVPPPEACAPEPAGPPLPAAVMRGRPPRADMARHLRMFWAAIAVVIAMLAFLVYRIGEPGALHPAREAGATVARMATGAIGPDLPLDRLPPVHIAMKGDGEAVVRLGAALRAALAGFDTIDFIARDVGPPTGEDAIRYVFSVEPASGDGAMVELENVATGKVLLSRTLTAADVAERLDDRIAEILSATVPVSGTLYSHVEQNRLQSGLIACLLLNDDYYLDQKPQNHEAAYRCLETLAEAGSKSPLVYSELAALHLEAVTDGYAYPPGATPEAALALAHRAVTMGATSPYAHRAYGFLLSRTGSAGESIRWMRRAYELNPYDLSMAAAYGYAMIFSGDGAAGTPMMARAVELSSAHPNWWDYGLFLGAFLNGDMQTASRAAEPLAVARRPHYLAARLVVAAAEGRRDAMAELALELAETYPKFTADPAAVFRRGNYPPILIDKFTAALRAAGLGGAS